MRLFDRMPPSTVIGHRHIVTVDTSAAGHRKIFSVSFAKDETVYVHLPYFAETDGLLVKLVGRMVNGSVSVERAVLPHTTTNRVKFAYHPTGRMHFSQTGKVKTVVIGELPPLVIHSGVLFQVQACGFNKFESVAAKDQGKSLVDCTPDSDAFGVVVTGYVSKPGVMPVESSGEPRLIARSEYSPMLIAMGYKLLRAPPAYSGSHLLFSGGPTTPIIDHPESARSVLSAAYPRGASVLFPGAASADLEK